MLSGIEFEAAMRLIGVLVHDGTAQRLRADRAERQQQLAEARSAEMEEVYSWAASAWLALIEYGAHKAGCGALADNACTCGLVAACQSDDDAHWRPLAQRLREAEAACAALREALRNLRDVDRRLLKDPASVPTSAHMGAMASADAALAAPNPGAEITAAGRALYEALHWLTKVGCAQGKHGGPPQPEEILEAVANGMNALARGKARGWDRAEEAKKGGGDEKP